jgi:hypothetical protein
VTDEMVGVKGKVYLYDENPTASAAVREYDDLSIWKPEQSLICPSGQSLEIRNDAVERENSGGTYWSPVPLYRGAHFGLDPAGDSGRINRIAVKMRRNDTGAEPDDNLSDKQSAEALVKERFLMPK